MKRALIIPEQLDAAYVADESDTHDDTHARDAAAASAAPGYYSVIT